MSDLIGTIDSLEDKISRLLDRYDHLQQQNIDLERKIGEFRRNAEVQSDQLRQWEEKFSALKNANAMLGSDEYKRETKLKINALIREIDTCIAQLSE
ncbi:hypothetical protein ACJRPK_11975 [Aquimarina sp. 2-A2]|uniref:Cell division protein ZapB n=1 Tax=Aquimarina intermedia TaxID=350814 RepID=A0A5S5BUW1_9FLAO|nr:hypothetical protein [Aquimarina intermedia]TYP69950.1 hypothetical protein BD809_11514 [Aquimarina intermedia]